VRNKSGGADYRLRDRRVSARAACGLRETRGFAGTRDLGAPAVVLAIAVSVCDQTEPTGEHPVARALTRAAANDGMKESKNESKGETQRHQRTQP
jgi:hypothetical protein